MNILHISTFDNRGGAAKVAWHLRERLIQRGHTSPMFVGIKHSNDEGVKVIPWRPLQHKLIHLTAYDLAFTNSDWILNTEEFKNADVIHCHNLHSGFFNLSTLEKISKVKPVVWSMYDLWAMTGGCTDTNRCLHDYPRKFLLYFWDMRPFLERQKQKIYARTKMHVVADSYWMKSQMETSILKNNNQSAIPAAIDTKIFTPSDKALMRKKLGLPEDKQIILFVAVAGNKNLTKGWDYSEKIIEHYRWNTNIIFMCIGGTKNENDKNIIYVDYIKDEKLLAEYYSASDIFLYPTLADSFGLVVAEAMACGVPVVTFHADAIPELVEHKKNGYVAKYKDYDDLLVGFQWIQSLSEEEKILMRKANTEKINEYYSLDLMTEKFITLYKQVIADRTDLTINKNNIFMNIASRIKNKIQRIQERVQNQIDILQEKRLPEPTKKEQALIDTLRNDFKKLSNAQSGEKMTTVWSGYSNNLQKYIKTRDPRNFLRWDIIRYSMFYGGSPEELNLLKRDWSFWSKAVEESKIGNPTQYPKAKETSGNMLHYAYHIALLKQHFLINPKVAKQIFEFGGGYGGMARLFFNLGFSGNYTIFDLPEFSNLQKYYLQSTGLHTQKNALLKNGVSLFDKIELLTKNPVLNTDIFIATWSLSETPLELRGKILSLVKSPTYYLIAYQKDFKGIDNKKYFTDLEKNMPQYEWKHFEIEHLKGNYYLLGKKNNS